MPVRVETIPVRRGGRVIAVIARNTNLLGVRTPSRLELSYLQTAADLTQMIAARPLPGRRAAQRPRRLAAGRRRLRARRRRRPGGLRQPQRAVGLPPARAHRRPRPGSTLADADPRAGAAAAPARRGDAERGARRPGATATPRSAPTTSSLIVRSIPLRPAGRPHRRAGPAARRHRPAPPRPRAGHQGRHDPRDPPPGEEQPADRRRAAAAAGPPDRRRRTARAALEEAVRRVGSIAIVHETLSQAVEEQRRLRRDRRPARADGHRGQRVGRARCGVARTGTFGVLPSEVATALAMVLTEVLQNAVEHGYDAERTPGAIVVDVPAGWSAGCRSPSRTTAAGCPRASTSTGRPTWGSRSCARWWSPSSAVSSRSARRRAGRAGPRVGARRTGGAESPAPVRRCGPGRGRCAA